MMRNKSFCTLTKQHAQIYRELKKSFFYTVFSLLMLPSFLFPFWSLSPTCNCTVFKISLKKASLSLCPHPLTGSHGNWLLNPIIWGLVWLFLRHCCVCHMPTKIKCRGLCVCVCVCVWEFSSSYCMSRERLCSIIFLSLFVLCVCARACV